MNQSYLQCFRGGFDVINKFEGNKKGGFDVINKFEGNKKINN